MNCHQTDISNEISARSHIRIIFLVFQIALKVFRRTTNNFFFVFCFFIYKIRLKFIQQRHKTAFFFRWWHFRSFSMEFFANKLSFVYFYSFLISRIIKLAITHIGYLWFGRFFFFFFFFHGFHYV